MVDIQCGEDIDACCDKLLHINIALVISNSWYVAMCQLVDNDGTRSSFANSIDIQFLKHMPLVLDTFAWDYLNPAKQFLGILPPVRLN